jgi:peptidoglycan-N-acetylglucosamine deacetylase
MKRSMRALFCVALLTNLCGTALGRNLAFTFDDGLNPETTPDAAQWNSALLQQLQRAGITTIVFPSLARTGMGDGLSLIGRWSEAGHGVGNHTASHMSLNSEKTTLAAFLEDVSKADSVLSAFPTWTPMLRFPFLKEGSDALKRDGVRLWLKAHDYRAAAVSIDTSDWYYNLVYLQLLKRGDKKQLNALHEAFIAHITERANYYDKLALRVLKRSPDHIMLLHVSAINSAWLGDVVAALSKDGWTIRSAQQAYMDELYQVESPTLPAGESIIWSLAKAAGIGSLRYPAEDSIYEEPKLKKLGLVK